MPTPEVDFYRYSEGEASVIHDKLLSFPFASDVHFRMALGYYLLFPPGFPIEEWDEGESDHSYRLQRAVHTSYIGGQGISDRDVQAVESQFKLPGFGELLVQERGRIVILGNGLSNIPVALAKRYAEGELEKPPVVVDLFDYRKLQDDIAKIEEMLAANGVPLPFDSKRKEALAGIVTAADAGQVTLLVHKVINADWYRIPSQCQDASLVLNIVGPPPGTISSQLEMLRSGGRLLLAGVDPERIAPLSGYRIEIPEGSRNVVIFTKERR